MTKPKIWFAARLKEGVLNLLDETFWTDETKARTEFSVRHATTPAFLMESRDGGESCCAVQSPRGEKVFPIIFDVPTAIKEAIAKSPGKIVRENRESIVSTMPGWMRLTSSPKGISVHESVYKTFEDGKTVCLTMFECGNWYHSVMTVAEGTEPDVFGISAANVVERSVHPLSHVAREAHSERKRRTYLASNGQDVSDCGCQKAPLDPQVIHATLSGGVDKGEQIKEAIGGFCARGGNASHMIKSWHPLSEALEAHFESKNKLSLTVVSEATAYVVEDKVCWGVLVENKKATWPMVSTNPVKDFIEAKSKHAFMEGAVEAFEQVKKIFIDTMEEYGISDYSVNFYHPEDYFKKHVELEPDKRGVLFAIIDGSDLYKALSGAYNHPDMILFARELVKRLKAEGFTYGRTENAVYVAIVPIDGPAGKHDDKKTESFSIVVKVDDGSHKQAFTESIQAGLRHLADSFFLVPLREAGEITSYVVGTPLPMLIEEYGFPIGTKIAHIKMNYTASSLREHQAIFEDNSDDSTLLTWMMVGTQGVAVPVREGYDDDWEPRQYIESSSDHVSYEKRGPKVGEIILDPRPFIESLVKIINVEKKSIDADPSKGRPNDYDQFDITGEVLHTGEQFEYSIKPPNWSEDKCAPVGYLVVDPESYYEINADQKTIDAYRKRHQVSEQVTQTSNVWSDNPRDAFQRFDGGNPAFRREHPGDRSDYTVKVFEDGSDTVLQSRKGQFQTIERAVDEGKSLAQAADKGPETFVIKIFDEKDSIVHEEPYDAKQGFNEASDSVSGKFINSLKYQRVKFKDMPKTHQQAIMMYMIEEAWQLDPKKPEELKKAIKLYGDLEFGIGEIPLDDRLKKAIMSTGDKEFKSFEDWAEWYANHSVLDEREKDKYNEDWPVILGSPNDSDTWGVFQDGWHRFAFRYLRNGASKIPFVKYFDGVKYFNDDLNEAKLHHEMSEKIKADGVTWTRHKSNGKWTRGDVRLDLATAVSNREVLKACLNASQFKRLVKDGYDKGIIVSLKELDKGSVDLMLKVGNSVFALVMDPRGNTTKITNSQWNEAAANEIPNTGVDGKPSPDPLTIGAEGVVDLKVWKPAPARVTATGSSIPGASKLPVVGTAFGEGTTLEDFLFSDDGGKAT